MNRLFPSPSETSEASEAVDLAEAYPPIDVGRPWLVLSMISSIDGAIAVGEASGGLANPGDRAIFRRLRQRSDLVVVGSATAAAERYRPSPRTDLYIAVVSASGKLRLEPELLVSPQTLVIMPTDAPPVSLRSVRFGTGQADVAAAIASLRPRSVLVEGGPSLNGPLLAAGVIDEICMTVAPFTVSGSSPRLATGGPETLQPYALAHILEQDGYLYFRYLRK